MRFKIVTLVLLLALLLLAGIALAAPPPGHEILRHVIGGGGGHVERGIYTLDYTIGQPVVGTDSAGDYTLSAGFWGGGEAGAYKIYLPLVLRG